MNNVPNPLPAPEAVNEPTIHMQPDGKWIMQWPSERKRDYPVSSVLLAEFVEKHNALIALGALTERLVSSLLVIAGDDLPEGITPAMVAKDAVVLHERVKRTQ